MIAVIGLGNVVCGDDGLGVHAVARLRRTGAVPGGVELVEGGTAGLLLLPTLADARRVVLVDAIDDGRPPGALVRLAGEDWPRMFAAHVTPHDVGLRDLLGAAQLSGAWPEELVLLGLQPQSTRMSATLSPPVAAALDGLVAAVAEQLAAWAGCPA